MKVEAESATKTAKWWQNTVVFAQSGGIKTTILVIVVEL